MYYDADYIRAIEQLTVTTLRNVLFTDSASIRDVILFPQMRPEA